MLQVKSPFHDDDIIRLINILHYIVTRLINYFSVVKGCSKRKRIMKRKDFSIKAGVSER